MEDIVAVAVKLENSDRRFFITYGRIFGSVVEDKLAELVLSVSYKYALGGKPITSEVSYSLSDASSEPYFFECLYCILAEKKPISHKRRELWEKRIREEMLCGLHIYYCGNPQQRIRCASKFWSMNLNQSTKSRQ